MTQIVSIDIKTAKSILSELRELKQQVIRLSEKLEAAPPYGSPEWWKWSEKRADEDIKAGRYTTLRNKKELQEFLHSLKTS